MRIGYPGPESERRILALARQQALASEAESSRRRDAAGSGHHLSGPARGAVPVPGAELEEYIVQVVLATRNPAAYDPELARWFAFGASPRGTIALERCARAHAWLAGRDYVTPQDVQSLLFDSLRHRLLPSFEAEAEGIDSDRLLRDLLEHVPLP